MRSAPTKETKPAEGLCPWRTQGVSPVFRASLVQTSAALRSFRSAFGSLSTSGYTPPLALAALLW
jgi:hypothetical protein